METRNNRKIMENAEKIDFHIRMYHHRYMMIHTYIDPRYNNINIYT